MTNPPPSTDSLPITLPQDARLPINRCNLPAVIIGSLTYQRHPAPLQLDGIHPLHTDLFTRLDALDDPSRRATQFTDYMQVHYRLDHPEEVGHTPGDRARIRADYRRMLRGWHFNPDGREAAVLKGWVESRFGLTPRYHNGPLVPAGGSNHLAWLTARSAGLYNTNALESQLDLLYSYCQYEYRRLGAPAHLELYRGVTGLEEHQRLDNGSSDAHHRVLLLNNLNAFSDTWERADEFGDRILHTLVPTSKVVAHSGLLPGLLQSEGELLVIGGIYEVVVE